MNIARHSITYTGRGVSLYIYPIADVHLGATNCDEELLQDYIVAIRDEPHAYWVGMGDLLDCVGRKGDPRYRQNALASWARDEEDPIIVQLWRLVEYLRPIADKCLGLIEGNHEAWLLSRMGRDIYQEYARLLLGERADDLMLGVHGYIHLVTRRAAGADQRQAGRSDLIIYAHHGWGSGRTDGAAANALGEALRNYPDARVALLGHRHRVLSVGVANVHIDTRQRTRQRLERRHRWGVFCGSFLNGHEADAGSRPHPSYAEEAGYAPLPVGAPYLIYRPSRDEISVIINERRGKLRAQEKL